MRTRLALLALSAFLLTACGGGQRLNLLITSEPPDALVYVNDYPRGVTPVEVPYLYIWKYRVQLQHEGYESVNAIERIRKPWYNYIPFMSLLLDSLPFPIHHTVQLHYSLVPDRPADF